ncbi:MAG: SulP family inorganic anion transporter [Lewinellaceae bacterium]|nr:SulP family inorganic anion transporter [Lewinellaceae bacterium]
MFTTPAVWEYALIICLVASLETLLSIEAIDKIDPRNRITQQNRELVAQGIGNLTSGILGGLPITAVIVRALPMLRPGRTRNGLPLHTEYGCYLPSPLHSP